MSEVFKIMKPYSTFNSYLSCNFPTSVYKAKKATIDQYTSKTTSFYVCPDGMTLHQHTTCSQSGVNYKCSNNQFPNHPLKRFHKPCGTSLLKTVFFSSGQHIFYPLKVYCYYPLKEYIQQMLLRPGFIDLCRHWINRHNTASLADVYDGEIWKQFMNVKDKLSLNTIALMLNVDWFRPFKHLTYSVGVLYLTIMNLPRSHCFKKENVLTVGILPGPHEHKQHMKSFLDPLVSELVELQVGVPMTVSSSISSSEFPIRCLLLSVACDLPAARKVCGFLSHAAKHGCSKCFKEFPGKTG